MPTADGPRDAADLKKIVDRRLDDAVELRSRANKNREMLNWERANGQVDELLIVQDLLCIILDLPRTYAAQR
jgi:hypothetical protein